MTKDRLMRRWPNVFCQSPPTPPGLSNFIDACPHVTCFIDASSLALQFVDISHSVLSIVDAASQRQSIVCWSSITRQMQQNGRGTSEISACAASAMFPASPTEVAIDPLLLVRGLHDAKY